MKQITMQEALSHKEHRRATRGSKLIDMVARVVKRFACFDPPEEEPPHGSMMVPDFPLPPTGNSTLRDSVVYEETPRHQPLKASSYSFFRPNQPPPTHHLPKLPTNRRWSFPRFTTSTALNIQTGMLFEENSRLQARLIVLRDEVDAADGGIQQLQGEVDIQTGHAARLRYALRYAQEELDRARVGIRTVVEKLHQKVEQLSTSTTALQQARDKIEELKETIERLVREAGTKDEIIGVLRQSKFMRREALRGLAVRLMQRTSDLEEEVVRLNKR